MNRGGSRKGGRAAGRAAAIGWSSAAGIRSLEALSTGRKIERSSWLKGCGRRASTRSRQRLIGAGSRFARCRANKIDEIAPVTPSRRVSVCRTHRLHAALDEVVRKGRRKRLLASCWSCDGVVDPHNLGALIRSAEAAGAHGVIVGKHRAVGLTEAAIKASAGAAFHLPVVQVTNVTRTLDHLKKAGFWIVGASPRAEKSLWDMDMSGPVAMVIGSEGQGMSRLVEETCDFLVSLPMMGAVSSLNASVAGAIFLYETLRQRTRNV